MIRKDEINDVLKLTNKKKGDNLLKLKEFVYGARFLEPSDKLNIVVYHDMFNDEFHIFTKDISINRIISYAYMNYKNLTYLDPGDLIPIKSLIRVKKSAFKSVSVLYCGDSAVLDVLKEDLNIPIVNINQHVRDYHYLCDIRNKKCFDAIDLFTEFTNKYRLSDTDISIPDIIYDEIDILSRSINTIDKMILPEPEHTDKIEELISVKMRCFLSAWYSDYFIGTCNNTENGVKVHIDDRQVGSTTRLIQTKNRTGCKMLVVNQKQKDALIHKFGNGQNIITLSDLVPCRKPDSMTDLVVDDGIAVIKELLAKYNYRLKEIVIKKDNGVSIKENDMEEHND